MNQNKLDFWNLCNELITDTFRLSEKFPHAEVFDISALLRKASVSIIINLAEGITRKLKIERKKFFIICRAFLVEIDAQIKIGLKLKYVVQSDISDIVKKLNNLIAKMTKLILNT